MPENKKKKREEEEGVVEEKEKPGWDQKDENDLKMI